MQRLTFKKISLNFIFDRKRDKDHFLVSHALSPWRQLGPQLGVFVRV